MSFRVGQKVVCTITRAWQVMGPAHGDICTIETFNHAWNNVDYLILREWPQYINGCRIDFNPEYFRPVDETFGEEVAERVESLLQEEPEKQTIEI